MARHKKRFTENQITERNRIEQELNAIPPMHPNARKITTAQGFTDYFLQMRDLYNTHPEAYERLEEFHIAITGRRKYSEYDSFRGIYNKYLENA